MSIQAFIDNFYRKTMSGNPCCAGCDNWNWINSMVGGCTKSAPVGGVERVDMLGIESSSLRPSAGHVMTKRDHKCGKFIDSFDWS